MTTQSHRSWKRILAPWLFIAPILLLNVVVILGPSLASLYYSFTDWSGVGSPTWVGLANFERILSDPVYRIALTNNLKWTLIFLTAPVVMGLLGAALLAPIERGQMFFRVAYFIPYVIASVVNAQIWRGLLHPLKGIGPWLARHGISFLNVAFLGKESTALYIGPSNVEVAAAAAAAGRERGAAVFFAPGGGWRPDELAQLGPVLERVDVLLLSRTEAAEWTGRSKPAEAIRQLGRMGPPVVIQTLGAEGAMVLASGRMTEVPAFTGPPARDTTGAGDAFTAGLVVGFLEGMDWERATRMGCATAGLKVRHVGARSGLPGREEVAQFADGHNSECRKERMAEREENGKLIVTPIRKPPFTLDQLLAQVTEDNLHREIDTGQAVGNEVW